MSGSRIISQPKTTMLPAMPSRIPSSQVSVPAPVTPSSPTARSTRPLAAVPPAVSPTEITRPIPSPTSTRASAALPARNERLRGGSPHTVSIAVRRLADPAEAGQCHAGQPDEPHPGPLVDGDLDRLLHGVTETAGQVRGDVAEQPALQVRLGGQHERGDRHAQQHQREQRQEAEVGDGGGQVVAVVGLVVPVGGHQVGNARAGTAGAPASDGWPRPAPVPPRRRTARASSPSAGTRGAGASCRRSPGRTG